MSLPFINDQLEIEKVSAKELDFYLSNGFRHFGTLFFRYNISIYENDYVLVLPLRIRLSNFQLSKKYRKLLRQNSDLEFVFRDAFIDNEKEELFYKHSKRFKENIPSSIYTFVSDAPAIKPCSTKECSVFWEKKLIAYSFLDMGEESTSSIYAVFDPEYSKRSLGIYTMLLEIGHSIYTGKNFYYPGYAYNRASFYDYKKRFEGIEFFDWRSKWYPLEQ